MNSVRYRGVSKNWWGSEWYDLEMKNTFRIRSVQRKKTSIGLRPTTGCFNCSSSEAQVVFHRSHWPWGCFRNQASMSHMVWGQLHLLLGSGAGLPQGLLDNTDPQQWEKARQQWAVSLGCPESQISPDSYPVSTWNPKHGESLCNVLVASSSLLSEVCTHLMPFNRSHNLACGSEGLLGHSCSEQTS